MDVVVANILVPILLRLFDTGLSDLVEPGGLLLLSGMMDIQRDKMVERAQAAGLTLVEETTEKDWVAFVFRRFPF